LREEDIHIAIRVRSVRDVSVANAGVEFACFVEGFVRLRDLGQLREATPVPGPREALGQPQTRVLMGNNRRAGLAQALIRTRVSRVPGGVEERAYRPPSG